MWGMIHATCCRQTEVLKGCRNEIWTKPVAIVSSRVILSRPSHGDSADAPYGINQIYARLNEFYGLQLSVTALTTLNLVPFL